jgi:hypothetical protein
LLAVN